MGRALGLQPKILSANPNSITAPGVVPRLAASVSPENLTGMQILRLPNLLSQKLYRCGPALCLFTSHPGPLMPSQA